MTLNAVSWISEIYLLSVLLFFLWWGTRPVTEATTEYTMVEQSVKVFNKESFKDSPKAKKAVRRPYHGASYMTWCLLTLCFLVCLVVVFCPLHTLQKRGLFIKDVYSTQLSGFFWFYAAIVLYISISWQKSARIIHTEYVTLIFLALIGQHLLLYTADLMALYVCLELQSFSLVVLCSLNYSNAYSLEARMKYFLLSAFSSCLLLLRIRLVYWDTGLTNCVHLTEWVVSTGSADFNIGQEERPSLTLWLGLWLIGMGLLWKLAVAPLHLWAADVYMRSWSSVSLLISTLPKIAVLRFWTHVWHPIWSSAFGRTMAFFSGLSMIVRAIAPLAQSQLKRLLAFSSIGHMRLLLMPLAGRSEAYGAIWAHLGIYLISSLTVWGLLMWPFGRPGERKTAPNPQFLSDLGRLHLSSPRAATAWARGMLSLARLPPVARFLRKLRLFWWRLNSHQYRLVLVALVSTLLSSIYYLRVLKISYVDNPKSWGSYLQLSPSAAYIMAISWAFIAIALWHRSPVILYTHLLTLSLS